MKNTERRANQADRYADRISDDVNWLENIEDNTDKPGFLITDVEYVMKLADQAHLCEFNRF